MKTIIPLIFFVIISQFLYAQKVYTIKTLSSIPDTSILIFMSPQCPICEYYTRVLKQIRIDYPKINIIAIVPRRNFSKNEIKLFIKKHQINFNIFLDKNLNITKSLQASITPEIFFRVNNQTIYQGAIDDYYLRPGKPKYKTENTYLLDAIDSFLKNKPIENPITKAVGCFIEKIDL